MGGLKGIFGSPSQKHIANPIMMWKTTPSSMVVLVIYIDEILLLDSDEANISTMKACLHKYFVARAL